jgi:hypothetical protein
MSSLRDGADDYAAEAYELETEPSAKDTASRNTLPHGYNEYGDDDEYLPGEDTEDARAILLQDLDATNGSSPVLKSKEYDPSDDSAAAMVHRVRPSLHQMTPYT